ncbi:MAG TPA: collagen-like protein [bacterium]|nr:collagen-like protein [bacterium]
MRKILSASVVIVLYVVLVCALTLLWGCEGEQGPAGPAGEQGPAGADGTAVCAVCHENTGIILAKKLQWEVSGHATGGHYTRANSATCAPCHSSEGFMMKLAGEEVTGIDNPSPQNCRTCHNIHTNFDETDFSLATTAPVELTGVMYAGVTINIGKGNLCANCHQTREYDYGLEVDGPDVEITSTHWGPHHGTQAPIFTGNSGFEISGSVPYENSAMTTAVTDGCPTCHMATAIRNASGGHTLKPNLNGCEECHSDIESFDYNGRQTEITELFEELTQLLLGEGLLDGEEGEYHPVSGQTVSSAKAGALFNRQFVLDEGSHGVHNYKYTKALLQNSVEVF